MLFSKTTATSRFYSLQPVQGNCFSCSPPSTRPKFPWLLGESHQETSCCCFFHNGEKRVRERGCEGLERKKKKGFLLAPLLSLILCILAEQNSLRASSPFPLPLSYCTPLPSGSHHTLLAKVINDVHVTRSSIQFSASLTDLLVNRIITASSLQDFLT